VFYLDNVYLDVGVCVSMDTPNVLTNFATAVDVVAVGGVGVCGVDVFGVVAFDGVASTFSCFV